MDAKTARRPSGRGGRRGPWSGQFGVRYLTPELLSEADDLRKQLEGQPDRVIRRRIRDHLDLARRHLGPISQRGLAATEEEMDS